MVVTTLNFPTPGPILLRMLAPLSATQTLDRARSMMQSGRGAALPELLKLIETLSLNICDVTIPELAELIEKDAIVLAKIIAVANTLSHNPGITPLSTLSQAIHQLGYNRIRTIAVSLMLLDTAAGVNPAEQREAASHALCAGLFAQGVAEALGTHDAEFVFACTALRSFGRIMFAAVSAEHCREAIKYAPTMGDSIAYRAQFGLTPLEFTRKLLTTARMPEEVMRTLRDCEPESLAGVATTYDARLLGIVDFGTRLATISLSTGHTSDTYTAQTRALARRFERLVPGAGDVIRPALQRANERLHSFTSSSGSPALPTESLCRVNLRYRQLCPEEKASPLNTEGTTTPPIATTAEGTAITPSTNDTPITHAPTADVITQNTVAPLTEAPLLSSEPAAWDESLARSVAFEAQSIDQTPVDPEVNALALVREAVGAGECWLFTSAPKTANLTLNFGVGPGWSAQKTVASIHADERSVFGVCLKRREVVLIHDAADAALLPYLPSWLRQPGIAPAAFALVPLRAAGSPPALLLIGWPTARRIALSAPQITLTHQLLASALTSKPAKAA